MTNTENCLQGPNNFAMIPRIALIELNQNELSLYNNLVDIANPKTNLAQLTNKRLASRVGCTVKTLKKHRDRLVELGYIRLFYQDEYNRLFPVNDPAEVETHKALVVEIIDIWEANCRFAQVYRKTPKDKLAVLKNFLSAPENNAPQGDQNLQGVELTNEVPIQPSPLPDVTEGGGTNLPPIDNEMDRGMEANDIQGDPEIAPNKINKDLLEKTEKKTNQEIISLSERDDDFLSDLDNLFEFDDEPATRDTSTTETQDDRTEAIVETVNAPQSDPAWDKPYTQAEYEHFKDQVSLTALESDVYNPCHNTSHARCDFRQPTKSYTDWQKLVAVVEHFFPTHSTGYATKIAQQLAGKAKSGQRKDYAISPPMDAVEACAFAYWLREGERLEQLPERAERIQERAMQFRALTNHFEHVNFARYTLAELMASHENADPPEQDPNLFKPAPDDVLEKVYADAEAMLGFSLSGDF
ncbi:MAG: hypothetical protein CUN56_14155 [Phototrophicales bacterium]|nr:MAG: hypothetical protein CUN56_14155 [Phototrophicales bacterium]